MTTGTRNTNTVTVITVYNQYIYIQRNKSIADRTCKADMPIYTAVSDLTSICNLFSDNALITHKTSSRLLIEESELDDNYEFLCGVVIWPAIVLRVLFDIIIISRIEELFTNGIIRSINDALTFLSYTLIRYSSKNVGKEFWCQKTTWRDSLSNWHTVGASL